MASWGIEGLLICSGKPKQNEYEYSDFGYIRIDKLFGGTYNNDSQNFGYTRLAKLFGCNR